MAPIEDITLVRSTMRVNARAARNDLQGAARCLLAVELAGPPYFRAVPTLFRRVDESSIEVPRDVLVHLDLPSGASVVALPLE